MNKMPQNVWQALGLAWELGFIIAIPLVVFGSIGKYADGYFNTKPWLTLLGIFLSIIITVIWLYRRLKPLIPSVKNRDQTINSNPNQNQKL